jgi:hypothetical protein
MRKFDDRRAQRPAVEWDRDEEERDAEKRDAEELVHAVPRALSHLRDPRRPTGGLLSTTASAITPGRHVAVPSCQHSYI